MAKVVIGFAPTRRSIFSAPDAVKYADLTRNRLKELGVEFVDIDDISKDGLLHDDNDRIKIAEKFKERKVDGVFFPHGKFGTEYEVARLAKELNVPVLKDRMKMEFVCVIHNVVYLRQEKYLEDSVSHLHIFVTVD